MKEKGNGEEEKMESIGKVMGRELGEKEIEIDEERDGVRIEGLVGIK